MKNNYADWLEYTKREESATTGSLKLYYRRLKELNRDKALILNSMGNQFDSAKSIQPISDGNYLISGASRSQSNDVSANNGENDAWVFVIDGSGTLLFEKAIGGSALDFAEDAIQSNGKLIVVGNTESNDGDITLNKGIKDLLIIKIR